MPLGGSVAGVQRPEAQLGLECVRRSQEISVERREQESNRK
jgi:hypothetical protein